jgi:O-antigen ligase
MQLPLRYPPPVTRSGHADWSGPASIAAIVLFAVSATLALLAPTWFWLPLATAAAAGIAALAFRHTVVFSVAWLLIAGATLEMTLSDLFGPGAFQTTIAAVKGAELVLAAICILRYGIELDVFNPALGFLAMFVVGQAHGLHPDLTQADSLRSLAGSVAPFAFAFSRLPRSWAQAVIRATAWIPLLSVTAGAALAVAGLRPLFFEGGGERLAGLGHPAFLAGFCLAAIYANLIELYREGGSRTLLLLGVNFLILALTGARAPLAYAVAVTGLTLIFVPSPAFPGRRRMLPLLLAACLVPPLVILANDLSAVRLFNVLSNEAGDLSGRDLLWPAFEQAAATSPWFGWGVGAGNAVIPPDSELARLVQTSAAHNEYLRLRVEGGLIGLGLLVVLFVLWVVRHTRRLRRTDRVIMRLVFIAFAAHAYTDNVLIATTACVFFAFATAVFARGAREQATGAWVRRPGAGPRVKRPGAGPRVKGPRAGLLDADEVA